MSFWGAKQRKNPLGLKARCAFVRQSPPKSSIFILGTRWKSCHVWYATSTHTHICVLAFLCAHINVFLYIYAVITVWKYDRSCFPSKCVTSSQKIVSPNRAAIRGALVQIARCVYVTRNEDDTYHVILSQMPFWNANNHSTQYLNSLLACWSSPHKTSCTNVCLWHAGSPTILVLCR